MRALKNISIVVAGVLAGWLVSSWLTSCAAPIEPARADYQASFSGISFSGLTRSTTVAEYDGTVDDSGNLLDISGSNYLTYSSQFDNGAWTKYPASASVTADNEPCPVGNEMAELFNEGTVNDAHSLQMQPTLVTGTYVLSAYIKYKDSGRAWVYLRNAGAANKNAWFDVQTGVVGTVESLISSYAITSVGSSWYRVSIETTDTTPGSTWAIRAASADNTATHQGDGRGAFWVCGAQLSKVDQWRKGPGLYHPTGAANKPLHDLAPSATQPTLTPSYLQKSDGNRWGARNFVAASTQNYSVAHHASFSINTTPFTMSFVMAASASRAGSDDIYDHLDGNDGIWVYIDSSHKLQARLYNGSTYTAVTHPTSLNDGLYHAIHLVRTAADATFYVDGTPGTTVAMNSTWGTNNSGTVYLWGAGGAYYDGAGLMFRLDAEALSQQQVQYEAQRLLGFGGYAGGTSFPAHTFTRATSATTEFNNGSLGYAASGVPRVTDGFLSEATVTNLVWPSSNVSHANWAKTNVTAPTTSVVLLDGSTSTTVTMNYTNTGGGEPAQHYMSANNGSAIGCTNGVVYTTSADVKKPSDSTAGRNYLYVYHGMTGGTSYAYFDLAKGIVSSTSSATATIESRPNSWWHVTETFTCATSLSYVLIMMSDTDPIGASIAGTGKDELYISNLQTEASSMARAIVPTTTTTATKNADVLTIDPFKYGDSVLAGGETMHITFDQDPAASPVTSNDGVYSWTASGTRVRETTERLGTYWKFDGTGTQLSIADAAIWTPQDFSIVAAVVPETPPSTYGYIFGKYSTSDDDRSWALYVNQTGGCTFAVSHDGTNATFASKLLTCYTANRPLFLVATYDYSDTPDAPGAATGTSTAKLYVNDQTVVSDTAFLGPPETNDEPVYIGRSTGGSRFQGKILFTNYYNGTVLSATQVVALYEQFKSKWLVAPEMGNTEDVHGAEESKLRLNFSYKLRAASASAGGDSLVELSGNYGKSDANSNRVACRAITTTLVCSFWSDATSATERTITVSGLTQNTWHTVAYYLDINALNNSTMTVDGVAGTLDGGMTGDYSANFRDASVHVGHDYSSASGFANGWVKDVNLNSRP